MANQLKDWKDDYDWKNAFSMAVDGIECPYDVRGPIENVRRVIACDEGENDGAEWIAVVEWSDGKFAVMAAGCDYTGWDCQAGGTIEFYDSEEVALVELTPEQAARLGVPHDANKGGPDA
jgi:hypothetical protein